MAIGTTREVLVRLQEETLEPGDLVLLCSDGLYGPAGEAKIKEIISGGGDLSGMCDRLVTVALEGGGPDNITAVLLRNPG